MSTTPKDGGPAFPQPDRMSNVQSDQGMSLRVYIATAALKGLLSNPSNLYDPDGAAEDAVNYADALIAKLKGGSDG